MSAPIRLAFLLPHLRPGGAERVALNYLRALDRSRFKPFLFLGRRDGAFLDRLPGDVVVADLGGVRARRLPGRIARVLEAHRIDAAYSATDAMNLALLASRWRGARGTRRIVSVHTNPSAWLLEARHPSLRRWLMRRLYPRADIVAAPTVTIAQEMNELVGRRLNAVVLPNPVVEHIRPPAAEAAILRIVAAGRLVEAKGFDLLIDAAATLACTDLPFRVDIFGEGPLEAVLSRRIQAAGLTGRVALLGHASDPDTIFDGAHLCVLPSRREGFGNVLVEAMAAGAPVLAASCPGPAALIEHGRNGFLVESGSSDALAGAMATLLADPARRASVVPAGHRTAAHYALSHATRCFENVLAALLGNQLRDNHPDPGQPVH